MFPTYSAVLITIYYKITDTIAFSESHLQPYRASTMENNEQISRRQLSCACSTQQHNITTWFSFPAVVTRKCDIKYDSLGKSTFHLAREWLSAHFAGNLHVAPVDWFQVLVP